MCGILYSKDYSIEKIKHRGIYFNKVKLKNGNYLQHVSLPIQTDENNYFQPFESGNFYIAYNGEIFNYSIDKYESDIEFLKDYFSRFKNIKEIPEFLIKDFIPKYDGFYSIVIVDKTTNEILAFTDPLGKKQLYYRLDKGLNISSESFGISDLENEDIDKLFISEIIYFGYNRNNRTIFKNIKRILPGEIYIFQENINPTVIPYDNVRIFLDRKKIEKSIKQLIKESVKSRLKTIKKEYEIGILFSGGLDSTIILKEIIDAGYKDNVKIFSIKNSEDLEYVQKIEKEWGLKIHYLHYEINEKEYKEALFANQSPIDLGSVLPNYLLFREIKKHYPQIRVIFTGDGADELFGGYTRNKYFRSQYNDIFNELVFYHLPRLDKLSMYFTFELRNPFLSLDLISKSLNLSDNDVYFKEILKREYKDIIPDYVINRKKTPLKNNLIRKSRTQEELFKLRKNIIKLFLESIKKEEF